MNRANRYSRPRLGGGPGSQDAGSAMLSGELARPIDMANGVNPREVPGPLHRVLRVRYEPGQR